MPLRLTVLLRLLHALSLAVFATAALANAPAMDTGKRIALVIGNSAYKEAPLKNPVNDAKAIATTLRTLGFDVLERTDVTQKEMNRAITEFGERLRYDTVALFFFAGHGLQVRGRNYLVPVDAQITSEGSVKSESVDVDTVLEHIATSGSGLNLVILDACRNNPFERKFRSANGGGLAQMDAPKGTLIAYATAPGKTASDGSGANGLYTQELLKAMPIPGIKVEDVFKRVRVEVAKASNDAQMPWESSSLTGDFFFRPPRPATPIASVAPSPAPPPVTQAGMASDAAAFELELWRSAQQLDTAEAYEAYLAEYPNGRFARLGRAALSKLAARPARGTETAMAGTPQVEVGAEPEPGTAKAVAGKGGNPGKGRRPPSREEWTPALTGSYLTPTPITIPAP